jgi:hypothetical protein
MFAPALAIEAPLAATTDDWLCAGVEYRQQMASTLALIAGQGLRDADEHFFYVCIESYALSLDFGTAKLGDLGASCTFILTTRFADID